MKRYGRNWGGGLTKDLTQRLGRAEAMQLVYYLLLAAMLVSTVLGVGWLFIDYALRTAGGM